MTAVPSGSFSSFTVSSFIVSVPVLSVAIIVQEPSASMAVMFRAMTFAFAIRRMPMASATEMATGSPSGMALTARPTAIRNSKWKPMSRSQPTATSAVTARPTASAIVREKESSLMISGGRDNEFFAISPAILPISVLSPVAVTTPRPRPRVTMVPA